MNDKEREIYKIINGNSLEVLDTLEENSIDAIITDPPYELGFMGKSWDKSGIAYNVELWKKALRVLKPGGYLLAFGGTRTYHRICCAIEDAGFEIRDCIMWLYGSGFPKSMNIGLAIDKKLGVESVDTGVVSPNARPNCDKSNTLYESGTVGKNFTIKKATNEWGGWGTALKPAYEPIIVARKPVENSVVENVMKYGVGGINIDECRVGNETIKGGTMPDLRDVGRKNKELGNGDVLSFGQVENAKRLECQDHEGRWPANVIHDGSEEVVVGMPDTKSEGGCSMKESMFGLSQQTEDYNYHDEGSAARYFYCAKASKKDRDNGLIDFENVSGATISGRKEGSKGLVMEDGKQNPYNGKSSPNNKNIHPTVKPVDLMQYLVRLVSPKGAIILDIFNGSGSTGKAVAFENRERDANYKYIGIELDPKYCEISESRIDYVLHQFKYDILEEKQENEKTGQMSIFDFMEDDDEQ